MRTCALFLWLALAGVVNAATWYVRDGGSGSGTSWSDAYDELSSAETVAARGDTIYVADGTYSAVTFNTAASGTTTITIKKATIADHGTETGWDNAYGDGQANFSGGLTFSTSYWTVTGQTRDASDWADGTAYGIKCTNISIGINVNELSFDYINVAAGTSSTAISLNTQGSSPWRSGFYFGHMFLGNCAFSIHSRETSNVTIEYSQLGPTYSKECISHQFGHGWIIRWSKFIDNGLGGGADTQTAAIGVFNFSGGGSNEDTDADNWEIYGCIFAGTAGGQSAQDGLLSCKYVRGWKFYNNTIYNTGGNWGAYIGIDNNGTGDANLIRNNLFAFQRNYEEGTEFVQLTGITGSADTDDTWIYKGTSGLPYHSSSGPAWIGGTVLTGSEDPFVDKATLDLRLKDTFSGTSPKNAGTALGAPYNVDMNGNTRGADGTWDIGAFEYQSGGGGGTYAPTRNGGAVLNLLF